MGCEVKNERKKTEDFITSACQFVERTTCSHPHPAIGGESETVSRSAHQAPLSKGFPRQEDWSGLSFPSPGGLPDTGTEPRSPALQADSLPSESLGKLQEVFQDKE